MIFILKLCKKSILIQPPGEPREHHLGEVLPKSLSYEKFQPHLWYVYLKMLKNCGFLSPVTSILTFLQFSQKCARLYRPFWSFCLL